MAFECMAYGCVTNTKETLLINLVLFHAQIHADYHCAACDRYFGDANELRVHLLKSKVHNARRYTCSGWDCGRSFVHRSDCVLHLENGSCYGGVECGLLNRIVAEVDHDRTIIERRKVYNRHVRKFSDKDLQMNRCVDGFECPMVGCQKSYPTVDGLRAHLKSPTHAPDMFRCPMKYGGCNKRFKAFSGLLSHLELSRCGAETPLKEHYTAIFDSVLGRVKDFQPPWAVED